ncbi:MAG: hypothetical protein VCA35_09845 [Roseibacillus sp.]
MKRTLAENRLPHMDAQTAYREELLWEITVSGGPSALLANTGVDSSEGAWAPTGATG